MIDKGNKTIFDILAKSIQKVYDKNNNEIPFTIAEIKQEKSKHSAVISNVLYLDNKLCTNAYRILYLCRCGNYNNILFKKFRRKTNLVCQHCIQNSKYEYYVHANKKGISAKKRIKHINIFDNESDDFKKHYHNTHLTVDEFFYYLPYIQQINNTVLTEKIRNNIDYKYALPVNNQIKYTSKVSFDNGITYETIKKCYLKCSCCNKLFNIHIINLRNKNLNEIKCSKCILANHVYKIRLYDEHSNLTYQSNLEKSFIDKCKKYKINIVNGLEIPYMFHEKLHTYISDFYLPDYKIIIEIKSKNQFYKNDLKSGKLQAKNTAALNYNSNIKFVMLFDNDIDNFIETLLNERDSLNYCENNRNQDKELDIL